MGRAAKFSPGAEAAEVKFEGPAWAGGADMVGGVAVKVRAVDGLYRALGLRVRQIMKALVELTARCLWIGANIWMWWV